ncbi:hypothetical protein BKA70DRAFT_1437416 [Coprinopsis sp. MPI-PUGE-AT-0042]|nr:hypothetical protein BKA70DRAFT_1437416 [Coprinopsis sp. MPI-PUGE-AT-0042]
MSTTVPDLPPGDFRSFAESWIQIQKGRPIQTQRQTMKAKYSLLCRLLAFPLVAPVASWLASCIGVADLYLPSFSVISLGVELVWLKTFGDERGVEAFLIALRKCSDQSQLGIGGVHHSQHNILFDLEIGLEGGDELADVTELVRLMESAEFEHPQGMVTEITENILASNVPPASSFQAALDTVDSSCSPPRKKLRREEDDNEEEDEELHPFLSLSIGTDAWRDGLKEQNVWEPLCRRWAKDLRGIYVAREANLSEEDIDLHLRVFVLVLREMRGIPPAVYGRKLWALIVKRSGLPLIIADLGNPSGLAAWRKPLMVHLYARHALEVSLHLALRSWIPAEHILVPAPLRSATSALRAMSCEDAETSLNQMFRTVKSCLYKALQQHKLASMVKDPLLRRILERTVEITASVKKADKVMSLAGRPNQQPCSKCQNLPVEEQCVQDLKVKVSTDSQEHLVGCGVSFHPEDKVVRAAVTAKAMKPPKKVYHPDELHLQKISPDEPTISRLRYMGVRSIYGGYPSNTPNS